MPAFAGMTMLLCVVFLTGCGFQPMYGGARGPETRAELASVRIAPIDERVGQMLRNQLLDSMNPTGTPQRPVYRLEVILTETKEELGLLRTEFATRANLRLTAAFTLLRVSDGLQLHSGASNIAASYNILSNDYATLAAEADARARGVRELSEDITQRLAVYFRRTAQAAR